MNIDTGLAVVIVAVLIFYLRLIVLQRERAKQVTQVLDSHVKKKNQRKASMQENALRYSILSPRRRDRVIAGIGVLLILLGVLAYIQIQVLASLHPYWWIPTSIGIVAFSWAFKL